MNEVLDFLKKSGTFYLATIEDDQPRVRPFGAVCEFENKIYITTSNQKKVYQQILANPKVEISGMSEDKWIRVTTTLVPDERREPKTAMLDANPSLRGMYSEDDGKMAVLYFDHGTASIESFTEPKKTIEL
ncbi:MAG: pyridoxamine 5'-phosphate oxidase family protein [Lachnospiraceae bacterium]|nr:pyridoxamine 5'-phosphate oxidase family protein [Lachnospiraceae bacterium]